MTAPARHLYLVDGSGYVFRAYFAMERARMQGGKRLTRADGTPTGAVLTFTQMLLNLIEKALADKADDYLAVIFDAASTSFRNAIYPEYKANREDPPDDLVPQFALVREATRALGLPCIELPDYEADDIIAAYAKAAAREGFKVTLVTSDKDMMQLIGDGIAMHDPMKDKPIGRAEVIEKFGVPPEKVIDVQALCGDSTDNVPGVPGIGVKTAAELISTYGDLETLLARASEIKQPKRRETLLANAENARLSKRLVTLDPNVPLPEPLDSFALKPPEPGKLRPFLIANELKNILARLDGRGGAPSPGDAPTPTPAARAAPTVAPTQFDRAAQLVTDEAQLSSWLDRARAQGRVAIELLTDGRATPVGIGLAVGPNDTCYVPLAADAAAPQSGLSLEPAREQPRMGWWRAVALLKPLLEDEAVLKIGHNLKDDALVLARSGVRIAPCDDVMLISFTLDAGRHGHGLAELAERHLAHKALEIDEVTGSGKARVALAAAPIERARDHAAEAADVALRLAAMLKPRLVAERVTAVYETIERPLIPVLAAMERRGVRVDPEALHQLSRDFAARMAELEAEIYKAAGAPFNIGSTKQLGEVLFEKLQLPVDKKGRSGAYSTDVRVLETLAEHHPLPLKVLDWRQLQKLKSTYADALLEQIDPATRRVHTCFIMTGAQTGRLASTDPNLQNIPVRTEEGRKIRRAFVAEPGWRLISLDYSQIELRLLAHVADLAVLKQAFRDNIDIHALTASQVFNVPIQGMDPLVRRRAKAINFGIIYGISAFGLAAQLGIPRGEAAVYIEAYFQRYPGIRDYMERTKAFARRHGYVVTPLGRRIHMTGVTSKNPSERGFAERQSINAPLQGGAADIIKRAMVRAPAALEQRQLAARLLLQVHDELLLEAPEAETEATIACLKPLMERAARPAVELSVPLVVEAGIGADWAEAH